MIDTLTGVRQARKMSDAQALLDAMPAPVLGADAAGRIHFANVAAADILAAPAGGLVGRRVGDVFGPQSLIASFARRAALESIRLAQTDIALEGPGFSVGRADFYASPVEEPQGAALVFMLRAAPRSDAVARTTPPIARTLAHEIRNPLAGIRAAAQLIGKDVGPDLRALTDMICAETDRIRRLTDRIDALDGLTAPKLAPLNVHEALDRARAVVSASFPALEIEAIYDPSLPDLRADIDQLIQVFLNIVKNAAEALRGRVDGRVTLMTRYRPGVRVRTGASAARGQMEITIADNGPGLPPIIAGHVFEPFATTKQDGAGLGLAIAAEIVARHGGRIEVESHPGRTLFRVLLPLAEDRA